MTYVYVIQSIRVPSQHYVGATENLRRRIAEHIEGKSPHTAKFRPWVLVAYFAFADRATGSGFERYLKTGSGKAFLHRHILPPHA